MEDTQLSLFDDKKREKDVLSVTHLKFISSQKMKWRDLFSGFDDLKASTFSHGLNFLKCVLELFDTAEIIFGCEDIICGDTADIIAAQDKTLKYIRSNSIVRKYLISRIEKETLSMKILRGAISHQKFYLLSSKSGEKRVVFGSANLSERAFTGKQKENISYIDGDDAYNCFLEYYNDLKDNSSSEIQKSALMIDNEEEKNIDENTIPVLNDIKSKKIVETVSEYDDDINLMIELGEEQKEQAKAIKGAIPKNKNAFSAKVFPSTIKKINNEIREKRERKLKRLNNFPILHIDYETSSVYIETIDENNKKHKLLYNLNPSKQEITSDVKLFIDFMNNYSYFSNESQYLQKRYFEFANWFFCSVFIPYIRKEIIRNSGRTELYPMFGIIYGSSNAGKTTLIEFLQRMVAGNYSTYFNPGNSKCTPSSVSALMGITEGIPFLFDDISRERINKMEEVIKDDRFVFRENKPNCPAIIFSTNKDVSSLKHEITKRAVCIKVTSRLSTEYEKDLIPKDVFMKQIGTAFFREYLRRMINIIPNLFDKIDNSETVDILNLSSNVICEIIDEHTDGKLPEYINEVQYNDYFGDDVLGKDVKEEIVTTWKIAPECFRAIKKSNKLIYTVKEDSTFSNNAKRIIEELPAKLEAKLNSGKIIMNLEQAVKFFGVNFNKLIFRRIK